MSAQNEVAMSTATDSPRTRFGRRQDTTLDCPCPQNIRVLVQFTAKARTVHERGIGHGHNFVRVH